MKRAKRLLGILTIVLFLLGLVFKYMHWTGGSILITASLPVFILGYLPLNYIIHQRRAVVWAERLYLVLQFITYALVLTSAVMIVQHWVGGNFLLYVSIFMVFCMILLYAFLRIKKRKRFFSDLNDIVVASLLLGIFIYMSNPKVSRKNIEGYELILDQYEKQNAGIESAIGAIYVSANFVDFTDDPALKEGIDRLWLCSRDFFSIHDSLKRDFIRYCNTSFAGDKNASAIVLNRRTLTNGEYGLQYFIQSKYGQVLKDAIQSYRDGIEGIAQDYHIYSGLIGLGLEVEDIQDAYGNSRPWEVLMFDAQPVSSVMNNLLWIRQMALRTEAEALNGLVSQLDLSEEMKYLQEEAARESEKAMDLKENELIRSRQQQELQSLLLEQNEAILKQRKTMIISAFAGIAFVLSLLVISTRAFYLKRKDNKRLARQKNEITGMNDALNQRNEEIMAQNDEILAQRDEIEAQRDMVYKQKDQLEKNHGEISSSIEYAKRLQTSILPSPGLLKTRIKDHFVVFMPKQRVSGDFYWWTQIEDHVVITAADCTGHGVPGAFMSMLGVSMLREIVSKEYISHPGVILRRLRKEVMHALKQTGEFGEQKDGMDMAMVSINVETLECQYAGANNPLYLVRNGELTEFKADRMPIAIHQNMAKFTMHEFQLQKGDHLYLFSDGYVDQFGGPDDKKFKFKAFRQMLVDHSTQPMKKQKQILESTINDWKGERDQVDDMVVLGLEI